MKSFLIAVFCSLLSISFAQTTGEQRFMGDATFENPVTVNDTLHVTGAVTNDAALTQTGAATLSTSLTVNALNASTTGQVVNGAASATADLASFRVNGSTRAMIGANGFLNIRLRTMLQMDTTTPDHRWDLVYVTNHVGYPNGAICVATGTAVAQFAVINSTGGTHNSGCGSGE